MQASSLRTLSSNFSVFANFLLSLKCDFRFKLMMHVVISPDLDYQCRRIILLCSSLKLAELSSFMVHQILNCYKIELETKLQRKFSKTSILIFKTYIDVFVFEKYEFTYFFSYFSNFFRGTKHLKNSQNILVLLTGLRLDPLQ